MSDELKYCKFCDKEKPIKDFSSYCPITGAAAEHYSVLKRGNALSPFPLAAKRFQPTAFFSVMQVYKRYSFSTRLCNFHYYTITRKKKQRFYVDFFRFLTRALFYEQISHSIFGKCRLYKRLTIYFIP